MAVAKSARVREVRELGPEARWVALSLAEPLGFSGGQYIIADSGLTLPNGKAAKRAYSPISCDDEQSQIELVVKRIGSGLVSNFMHRLQPGDELRFSGPWGKLAAPPELRGPVLVLATDTGVTAALGLLSGQRFRALLPHTRLVWLRVGDADFVSEAFVRERVPSACGSVSVLPLLPVHHPERLPRARAMLAELLAAQAVSHALLCGDGVINYGLMADFAAHGVTVTRNDVESFFNMPAKASAVKP